MTDGLIVAIDDDEAELKPNVPEHFELDVVDPNDPKLADRLADLIPAASLILLDQKFNSDLSPLSLIAADGASFVSHLRSWSRAERKALPPIVLFTNETDAFRNEVPSVGAPLPLNGSFVGREFQIAPALDVEWIQYKGEDSAKNRIEQIVEASNSAREIIGDDGVSLAEVAKWLSLPERAAWSEKAHEDLRGARPPVTQPGHDDMVSCGPSQMVRWMCHRALAFPGLLFSDLYAAWALGVSLETFQRFAAAEHQSDWLNQLSNTEYYGALDTFSGRRWWKSGIDNLAWKLDQETSKVNDRRKALAVLAPNVLFGELHSASSHVVVWTPELVESSIAEMEDSVQLHPPGWPAEAFEPWVSRDELKNDEVLQAMAEQADIS